MAAYTLLSSYFILHTPAISVEFEKMGYSGVEGESVDVCVVLVGETDSPIEVSLNSLPDTATGWNYPLLLLMALLYSLFYRS